MRGHKGGGGRLGLDAVVTVRLTPDTVRKARAVAAADDRTLSNYIMHILKAATKRVLAEEMPMPIRRRDEANK